jgi:hypothetical protein
MSITKENQPSETLAAPNERKTLGIAALAGLTLFLVSLSGWTPESPESGQASAQEIRQYAADNADVLQFAIAGSLLYIGLFVVFIAALVQLVRGRRPGSVASGVLLLCGAASVVDFILLMAVTSPFAFPDELDKVSDGTVVSWWNLVALAEWSQYINTAVPRMVLIVAFSLVALRTGLMVRWVCWAGVLVAAVGLFQVPAAVFDVTHGTALDHTFLVAIFGWWLWPLAVGVALGVRWLRTRPRDRTRSTAGTSKK